jgi:cellulose synthase/poly-beta-1,6-N-acetylglucosamine synthase-like glycosyltransferase
MQAAEQPQPSGALPSVSVIVPVYNAAGTLDPCLVALSQQTVGAETYEVIVVDDGSTDGSAAVARKYDVTVLQQPHSGAAAARNRGARQARGQILLFTDADCEPLENWIECMVAPFADPDVAGVKGAYRTCQRSLVARFAQAEYEEKYRRMARMQQIDFVDTYAAAYRRELFRAHGGFDPRFELDEDQEFSFRVANAGHKLVFAPGALVYHRHQDTVWGYARRKLGIGRWKVEVHARHPARALRDAYTPWSQKIQIALVPLTLALAVGAARGRFRWRTAAGAAGLGLASTLPLACTAQHQGWGVALASPFLALLRAVALALGLACGLLRFTTAGLLARVGSPDPARQAERAGLEAEPRRSWHSRDSGEG